MNESAARKERTSVGIRWHLLLFLSLAVPATGIHLPDLRCRYLITFGVAFEVAILFWIPAMIWVYSHGRVRDRVLFTSYPAIAALLFMVTKMFAGTPEIM